MSVGCCKCTRPLSITAYPPAQAGVAHLSDDNVVTGLPDADTGLTLLDAGCEEPLHIVF